MNWQYRAEADAEIESNEVYLATLNKIILDHGGMPQEILVEI